MSSIYFHEEGSGPPLVFLHGFCDSHELWNEFIRPFTVSYRVLTPDLPGFGKSPALTTPFTLDQVGDAMAAWLLEQGVERPLVIGHSLGGYVAMSLLARHSALLAGICLFHSTPNPDSTERKSVRDKVIQFVKEKGVAPFVDTFVPGLFLDKKNPEIEATRRRALSTPMASLLGYAEAMRDRPDRLETFFRTPLPALLIGGANDSIIPIGDLNAIAQNSPKSEFHRLDGVAHMGIFEARNQCQAIILQFAAHLWPNKGI